jgi:GT2 family glycosyltransferase
MHSTAKISFIVPCFNRAASVGLTIESIRLDAPLSEIIVVDDGSTDRSWEVISAFSDVIARRVKNQGVSSARNVGLSMATREYVRFVDSDDTVLPGSSQELLSVVERNLAAVGRADDPGYGFPEIEAGSQISTKLLFRSTLPLGLALVPRSALVQAGGFSEQLSIGEDQELAIRLARNGLVFQQIDCAVYRVGHQADNRLTRGDRKLVFDRLLVTLDRLTQLAATQDERLMIGQNAWSLAREASRHGARAQASDLFEAALKVGGKMAIVAPCALRLLYRFMQPFQAERVLAALKRIAGR